MGIKDRNRLGWFSSIFLFLMMAIMFVGAVLRHDWVLALIVGPGLCFVLLLWAAYFYQKREKNRCAAATSCKSTL